MPTLRKDLRSQLEKTVLAAREIAEKGARETLEAIAVHQSKAYEHLTSEQRDLRNRLRALGRQAGDSRDSHSNRQTLEHLTERIAYEHWHRMLFARFLAENDLLLEPEHQVPVSLADVEELAREENADIWELASKYAQRMLPGVFRSDDPALSLSLPRETRVSLERLLAELPSDVFTATDSLGWCYQFWQDKRKEEVNRSGRKIGADDLPAVTQLFTEDYMVDFLLDNTLGAWWAGKVLAAKPVKTAKQNPQDHDGAESGEADVRQTCALPGCPWTYLRFIQDDDGYWAPAAGVFKDWPATSKEITCLDPCMGSGHFLVALFNRPVVLRMAEE
jgi:hypothetical protein